MSCEYSLVWGWVPLLMKKAAHFVSKVAKVTTLHCEAHSQQQQVTINSTGSE